MKFAVNNLAAACLGLAAMAALASRAEAVTYFLYTGQTNAQTQIDINHTTTWLFTAGSDYDLGGGYFEMKDGPQTTADILLTLTNLTTATQIAQVSYTNGDFDTQHGGNPQSFDTVPFLFGFPGSPLPVTLTNGDNYRVDLTSPAPDQQAKAYFIKGSDSVSIKDPSGNPPPGGGGTRNPHRWLLWEPA